MDAIKNLFKDFSFDKVKDIFKRIINYFKNFKASPLYKFGSMIVAFVTLIVTIVKQFT